MAEEGQRPANNCVVCGRAFTNSRQYVRTYWKGASDRLACRGWIACELRKYDAAPTELRETGRAFWRAWLAERRYLAQKRITRQGCHRVMRVLAEAREQLRLVEGAPL